MTGEPLTKRPDDNAEVLKKRLEAYHSMTRPLVEYYTKRGLHTRVDAAKPMDQTFKSITVILDNIRDKAQGHAKVAASSKI